MIRHRPADDTPGPDIEHDREIQEARPGRHVGNVGDPEPIRTLGAELSIDLIERSIRNRIGDGSRHELHRRQALDAGGPHEPSDPLLTDPDPVIIGKLGMDARCAIGFTGSTMDRMDFRRQADVLERALRHRPRQPCIKTAGGDAQQPAHHPNRIGGLVRVHEFEDRFEFGTVS